MAAAESSGYAAAVNATARKPTKSNGVPNVAVAESSESVSSMDAARSAVEVRLGRCGSYRSAVLAGKVAAKVADTLVPGRGDCCVGRLVDHSDCRFELANGAASHCARQGVESSDIPDRWNYHQKCWQDAWGREVRSDAFLVVDAYRAAAVDAYRLADDGPVAVASVRLSSSSASFDELEAALDN